MREIKFRGVGNKDNLIYGQYFVLPSGEHRIVNYFTGENEIIDRQTLAQFTGLSDKNNQEIFENDKIKFDFDYSNKTFEGIVYFKNGCFYVDDNCPQGHLTLGCLIENKRNVEII
jgi:uncharacterized phage protein (TIGR01671 family)